MFATGLGACRRNLAVAPSSPSPVVATPTPSGVLFQDDFSTDRGWTYGTEWEVGEAAASFGHNYGNPDPDTDHSPSADDRVAGTVIGGNTTTEWHDFYYLTSPVIDTSQATSAYLSFWRWYNSDYAPYAEGVVEVWDGDSWQTLFSTGGAPGITDAEWAQMVFNLTPYRNPDLRVRFGHRVGSAGVLLTSGWNVDDVIIGMGVAPVPVGTRTPTPTATVTPTPAGYCGDFPGTCTPTVTPTDTASPTSTPTFTSTGYCGGEPVSCTPTETPTFTWTPTETSTPTLTPTCVHPLAILEDALIPDATPAQPLVYGTPVLVASAAECQAYFPGAAVCATVDFVQYGLILTHSVDLCGSSWLITGVEENCLGGLTLHAACYPGCACCDPPDEYRYTLIPATTRPINDVRCETP